jgi:hypothetical protein
VSIGLVGNRPPHIYGTKSVESQTTLLKILGHGLRLRLTVCVKRIDRAGFGRVTQNWDAARLLVDERNGC